MPLTIVKISKSRVPLQALGRSAASTCLLALTLAACGQDRPATLSQAQIKARWHNNQGVVYMDQHNYTRGKEEFERAVSLDPEYANGYANLGISFFSLGKFDSALTALQTTLKHDVGHLHGLYTRGLLYLNQGKQERYGDALAAFELVASADPDDPLVRYYIARTKAKLGRQEEAVLDFKRTIELDPTNVSAYYAMAQELQRMGRQEEWKEALETFQQLSQAGGEGVSSSYQGQGKYAEAAADMGDGLSRRDDIQIPFVFALTASLPGAGADAATTVDSDLDGLPEVLLADGNALRMYAFSSDRWEPSNVWTLPTLEAGTSTSDLLFGDCDDDGNLDAILSTNRGTLLSSATAPGLFAEPVDIAEPSGRSIFADVDHDGDLDLLLIGSGRHRLLHNDGRASFSDVTDAAGLTASGGTQAFFSDFDNDRDIDFLVASGPTDEGGLELFTNNRDGSFTDIAPKMGLAGRTLADIAVGDFDGDGFMDIATVGGSGATLLTNRRARFEAAAISAVPESASGVRAGDFDNDGDLDLAVATEDGIKLVARVGDEFLAGESLLHPGRTGRQLLLRDFDGDGKVDLLSDGELFSNNTDGGRWITISLQGLNSNPHGIGAKVEVKTTDRQVKRELRGGSRDDRQLTLGLAASDSVEFVRVLWPSGVRQTELACAANQTLHLTELNRKGTSCPILYAWDGDKFRFVSDFLGGAIIGYPIGPGEYNTPDTDEYLPLGPIEAKDGHYTLQITNALEEVIYLDAAHLLAVDHRKGLTALPNERLMSAPPYPDFGIFAIAEFRPIRAAVDDRGNDVLSVLREVDDDWYDGFAKTDIHGYGEEYALELDLGDLSDVAHPTLHLHGWVDYAHSTSNWAAWQRHLELRPPRLDVGDGNGGWVAATADMGCPAGLPKQMIVDLEGLFPTGDYRVRISTNTSVYWDQVVTGSAVDEPISVERRDFTEADLHWRGYPLHTSIKGTFAYRYDYDRVDPYSDWGTHEGGFTRFGDVTELLRKGDDQFVILLHGDEITLKIGEGDFPALAPGMERTFLFYADGFGKDMDFHSARSLSVAPLPFHGMSSYPYPQDESYPYEDTSNMEYILEYNSRWIKGNYD